MLFAGVSLFDEKSLTSFAEYVVDLTPILFAPHALGRDFLRRGAPLSALKSGRTVIAKSPGAYGKSAQRIRTKFVHK